MKSLLVAVACLITGLAHANGQGIEFKRDDIVGMWSYVSTYSQFKDGRKQNMFGVKPVGMFAILPNGRYSHIIMNPNLPKVASGRVREMTPEEAEKIAEGTLSHFGTYTVDEKAGTFTGQVERASFPNINGSEQVRTIIQLDRETLGYINSLSVAEEGAFVVALLRRVW